MRMLRISVYIRVSSAICLHPEPASKNSAEGFALYCYSLSLCFCLFVCLCASCFSVRLQLQPKALRFSRFFLEFDLYIFEKVSVQNVCENAIMQVGAHCEQFSCTLDNWFVSLLPL